MTIGELNASIQAFDLQAELDKIIAEKAPEIIKLNTDQLYSGIESTGDKIPGEYSPKTIKYKRKKDY